MAWRKVTSYRVFHYDSGTKAGTSEVFASYGDGFYDYDNLDAARAHHLIDLLRNEDPVYVDTASGLLQVALEPIGEGE